MTKEPVAIASEIRFDQETAREQARRGEGLSIEEARKLVDSWAAR